MGKACGWVLTTLGVLLASLATAWAVGAAGDLDTAYGTAGVADGGSTQFLHAAALADGSVVTVGLSATASPSFYAVQKFAASGLMDTTFGSDGTGIVPVFGAPPTSLSYVSAIAVAPDGRIFVAGRRTYEVPGRGKKTETVTTGSIVAFDGDGTIDTAFGTDGYRDVAAGVLDLAIAGSASAYDVILVYTEFVGTGDGGTKKGKKPRGTSETGSAALVLHRLDDSGADVTSFGDNGRVVDDYDTVTDDLVVETAIDARGRIVLLVEMRDRYRNGDDDMVVTRYAADGALDTSFGTSGRVSVASLGICTDIAVDGDGKRIIVAAHNTTNGDPAVVRYKEDGSATDVTYDVPSLADTTNPSEVDTWTRDIVVDSSGRVCVALWFGLTNWDMTVVRCLADGTRDTAFGPNADGLAEVPDLSDREEPIELVLDANGNLVMVGPSAYPDYDLGLPWQGALVRWLGD